MKKLITPIIYVLILLPLTAISVGIEMLMRSLGILGEWEGVIDLPSFIMFLSSIIVFGIPLFWLANLLMQIIEKPKGPIGKTHIRQSFFLYLITIFCLGIWIINGVGNNEEDGYFLMWTGISIIGIVTNFRFLIRADRNS